eukprot:m.374284 g.374284  ORF g.374284 m.374284 type:complete len:109 (+) comp20900_c0_seq2:2043-2369(+)
MKRFSTCAVRECAQQATLTASVPYANSFVSNCSTTSVVHRCTANWQVRFTVHFIVGAFVRFQGEFYTAFCALEARSVEPHSTDARGFVVRVNRFLARLTFFDRGIRHC